MLLSENYRKQTKNLEETNTRRNCIFSDKVTLTHSTRANKSLSLQKQCLAPVPKSTLPTNEFKHVNTSKILKKYLWFKLIRREAHFNIEEGKT